MKKISAIILTVLLLLQAVPFTVQAEDTASEQTLMTAATAEADVVAEGSAGENVTWVLTNDGVLTFSGSGPMKDYRDQGIFSTYYDPAPWWDYQSQIYMVVINEGITSIGDFAFAGHSSLYAIRLPDSLESIGWKTFDDCGSLYSVDIPEGVTEIGSYAFFFCTYLSHVSIPDTVSYIGEAAFSNCNLDAVHIPTSLTTLYPGTFVNCRRLTEVTIPSSVTSIYSQAFNGCTSLTDIRFEHDYDDELTFQHDDDRYPAFGGVSDLSTTIGVPNCERINPALTGYDWEDSGRTVAWYSTKAPKITSQPQDVTVEEKSPATFSVTATGVDLQYQWSYQEPGSDIWTAVDTEDPSSSYTLKPSVQQNGWRYRCTVFNSWGSAVSDPAVLTVIPLPAEPVFKSQSLLLSGQIGLNFFLYLPEIPGVDYSDSYMEFTVGKSSAVQRANFDPGFTNSAGTRYGFTCYVTTAEAADPIQAVFHYGNGKTVSKEYSVDRYIGYFDDHADQFSEKTIDLIHTLATYCLACQRYLSYVNGWELGTDHMEMEHAYGGIIDTYEISAELEDKAFVKKLGSSAVTKATYKLHLDSTTTVDVLLTVPSGTTLTAKVCPLSYVRSVLNNDSSDYRAIFCTGHLYRFYIAVLAYRAG